MATPVTKAQLARLKGVSRPAITKLTREGGRLHAAVLPTGRVDRDHPAVQQWLAADARKPAPKKPPASAADPTAPSPPEPYPPTGAPPMAELRKMTLDAIVRRYGHVVGFGDYVSVLKKIEETRKLEIANAERRQEVVAREFVQIHVFGVLRGLTRRLLRDAPKTIAKEIYAMALAERPIEDAEKAIRDGLGLQIMTAKTRAARALGGEGPAGDDD